MQEVPDEASISFSPADLVRAAGRVIFAVAVIALAAAYERHAHLHSFDIMLQGRADSLLGAVQDAEDPADNVMLDRTGLQLPSEDVYEVRDSKGRLLGRSANWQGPDPHDVASGRGPHLSHQSQRPPLSRAHVARPARGRSR